jgi:hypothetical protein
MTWVTQCMENRLPNGHGIFNAAEHCRRHVHRDEGAEVAESEQRDDWLM